VVSAAGVVLLFRPMLPDTLNNFDEFLVYDYEAVVSNLLVHLTTNVLANECCYYCLLQC
jgi:hypothetical protein